MRLTRQENCCDFAQGSSGYSPSLGMEKLWEKMWKSVENVWHTSSVNSTPALFENLAKKDYLHLFPGDTTDFQKVVRLLGFKKNDVARASNVPLQSVRYDPPRMPKELQERLMEWAVALNLVAQFFNDEQKTVLWFRTPNPLLGDMTPRDMIRVGRFRKLVRFIQTALSENEPPK
jgi:uncharacterized protein (DUF2384 family)